jgi:uncharacterized protein (TIGR03084 family)
VGPSAAPPTALQSDGVEVFDDLVAEQDRLETLLAGLDDAAWRSPSGAPGWSVADVVLHLAQTEEAVVASAARPSGAAAPDRPAWPVSSAGAATLDATMDQLVQAERAEPHLVFARWRTARRAAVAALVAADPRQPLSWAAAPLKPRTLATTRLAEHWAHGLDVAEPLGLPFPDTDRLRHVAWLAHGSLPYAFALAGEAPAAVRCELLAPDGSTWAFGPPDAASTIAGAAGAFCRVGARRLAPAGSGLVATGPHGPLALRLLRNYAA